MPPVNPAGSPFRSALAALMLLIASGPVLAAEAASTPEPAAPAESTAPAQPAAPPSDITARSQEALAELDRLRGELDKLATPDAEAAQIEALQKEVKALLPEGRNIDALADDPAALDSVMLRSRSLTSEAGSLIDGLTRDAETLEKQLEEIAAMVDQWQKMQAERPDLPQALADRVSQILKDAAALQTQARSRLNTLIELQNRAMGVRNDLSPITERISGYDRSRQTLLFEQNAPRVWELTAEHITRSSARSGRRLTENFLMSLESWAENSETVIGGHLLLLPVILLLLYRLRKVTDEPGAALSRPAATGMLIWLLIGVAIYVGSPTLVRVIYVVVAMIATAIVLIHALPREMRAGVLTFVVIALVHEVFQNMPVTEQLPRLAYLVLAVALTGVTWRARSRGTSQAMVAWGSPRGLVVGAATLGAALCVVSLVANVLGYVALARHLVVGVVDSTAVFLVLFAGFSSISEIIQVVLRLPALDGVRSIAANRYRLQRVLRKPLVWVSLLLWLWATLRAFGISDWFFGSVGQILAAEISVGEVTLSLGGFVIFAFAVWLAVWTSRAVRTVLKLDVLPRMNLPRGVPNTISMTVHYSIILIGLLIGVGSLGINLSNLAFIIGALGVGIGFGLQNVVNNFVSGLILIFEAPIQVGDTVQVGDLMGRVIQIGIRTSRVRTFDGSEVIVPNGDLVSNQVINWTLTDRQRRLELLVGVAYGSDPDRVSAVLRGVLEADEGVLEEPPPQIIFTTFGDSSLNFRILAWIADFDETLTTTHRLNTAINAALAEAGIAIPFPQRDLHLVSVAPGIRPDPAT